MKIPAFIRPGDVIGVTATSCGVTEEMKQLRFANAERTMEKLGYRIEMTENVYTADERGCSSSGSERGRQFNALFERQDISAVISAGGGDYLMEMLEYVDYDLIRKNPKWFQGYSDNTSLVYSIVTTCDTAAIYGPHFGDFGIRPWSRPVEDMLGVLDSSVKKLDSYDYYEDEFMKEKSDPYEGYSKDKPVCWMNGRGEEKIELTGRILGGCLDVIAFIIGTKYDGTDRFIEKYKDDGVIWTLESFDMEDGMLAAHLWQMKQAGYFRTAKGFVFGRPLMFESFCDRDYREVVMSIIGDLDIPVIFDADIGHKSPQFPLIEGVNARIESAGGKGRLEYLI